MSLDPAELEQMFARHTTYRRYHQRQAWLNLMVGDIRGWRRHRALLAALKRTADLIAQKIQ